MSRTRRLSASFFAPGGGPGWSLRGSGRGAVIFSSSVGELGYFTLSDIEAVEGHFGLRIERDMHFTPQPPLSVLKAEYRRQMRGVVFL